MPRHEDHRFAVDPQLGRQFRHRWRRAADDLYRALKRVNHGVAGDPNALGRNALAQQGPSGTFRRSKMPGRDLAHRSSVHFLRPGRLHVAGPQTGLHVC